MARPKKAPGTHTDSRLVTFVTADTMAAVNRIRGNDSASSWLRRVVEAAVRTADRSSK